MTVHARINQRSPLQTFSKVSRLLSQKQAVPVLPRHSWTQDRLQSSPVNTGQLQAPLQLFSAPSTSQTPSQPSPLTRSLRPLARPTTTAPEHTHSHSHEAASSAAVRDTGLKDTSGRAIRLTPEAHEGLNEIKEIARSKGIRVSINSSYRSVERQAQLFTQALKKYGSVSRARKWVAPPGKSRHNFGNAIDLNLLRNGKKIPQREFDAIIAQAGMYRPMSWETWHIEPLSTKASRQA